MCSDLYMDAGSVLLTVGQPDKALPFFRWELHPAISSTISSQQLHPAALAAGCAPCSALLQLSCSACQSTALRRALAEVPETSVPEQLSLLLHSLQVVHVQCRALAEVPEISGPDVWARLALCHRSLDQPEQALNVSGGVVGWRAAALVELC